jgi:Lipocalin-like domain
MNKPMTPAEIELVQQSSWCDLARTHWRSAMSVKEKFIGSWKLLSWKIEQAGGELVDSSLGPNPAGWIMYQRDGRMSVNIMRSDRPKFASNNLMEATSEEIKSGFEGYFSYCGSYDVNVPKGFIIHHLELSAFPNWVGTDQKRYFEFSGDGLTLKTPPLTLSGQDQVHCLIWKRLN